MKYTPPPGHGHKLSRIQRLIHQKCSKRMSATPDSPKVPKLKSSTPDAQTNTNPTQIRNRHLMHQKSSREGPPISSYSYMCNALCVGLPAPFSPSLCHASTCSNVEPTQGFQLPRTHSGASRRKPLSVPTEAKHCQDRPQRALGQDQPKRPKPALSRTDRSLP